MTLEGEDKKNDEAAASSSVPFAFPLVGSSGEAVDDDSDNDSEPAGDIDDFELEMDDPVRMLYMYHIW